MSLTYLFASRPVFRVTLALTITLALSACEAPVPALTPGCTGLAELSLSQFFAPSRLIAVGSNYSSGAAWTTSFSSPALTALSLGLTGDSVVRPLGRALAVLNRSPGMGDNVTFFSLRDGSVTLACQLSPLSPAERNTLGEGHSRPFVNVHDIIALDDTTVLVARYNLPALAVIDLRSGTVVRTLDLSPWAGTAPLPQPEAFARVGDSLWLTLSRLDDPFAPHQHGIVLRLDSRATRVLGETELPRPNPSGPIVASPTPGTYWVSTLGAYDTVGDGAIETLTEHNGEITVGPPLVTEDSLGGTIDAFAVIDPDRLVLKVAVTSARTGPMPTDSLRYLLWNRRDGHTTELLRRSAWSPAPPIVAGGYIWVGDPGDLDTHGAGLRVFTLDGVELTHEAQSVGPGMRPYDLTAAP